MFGGIGRDDLVSLLSSPAPLLEVIEVCTGGFARPWDDAGLPDLTYCS